MRGTVATMLLTMAFVPDKATGSEQVYFTDIAVGGVSGLGYQRTASEREQLYETVRAMPSLEGFLPRLPIKGRGIPGVAILDYDNDGDVDIYVTNGPGSPNSLFANQLMETGSLFFRDMAIEAGVAAQAQDSSGVCFGDIDNDGDHDLLVLGTGEPNILFRNNGDGTFSDITESSGIGGGDSWSSGATMGDINGDGLLDIFVANFADLTRSEMLFAIPFALNQHNQLFLNLGGNHFRDISAHSGIQIVAGLTENPEPVACPTHASAFVDFDQDGDVDLFVADDQAGVPPAEIGGVDRGMLHLYTNDGTGNFTDRAIELNINHPGAWMGFGFGDFDHNGYMDFFATNFGTYNEIQPDTDFNRRTYASRWYLGSADGPFKRPPLENVQATPFGWGASGSDYDNDGDTDIIFYGAMDVIGFINLSNPGVFLRNNGQAKFTYDQEALRNGTDHTRRSVQGMAVGDLNNDGFVDVVSVSNFDIPQETPRAFWPPRGGAFDGIARYIPTLGRFGDPAVFRYNPDLEHMPNGGLSVEVNSGNANHHVSIQLLGGMGLISRGRVNRDAIGAVAQFRPQKGVPAMKPVIGGSSYASQHDLRLLFGLGSKSYGTLEVLWPGGVRTRLYAVKAGERLKIPELPVSYNNPDLLLNDYMHRIETALDEYVSNGMIDLNHARRLQGSAKMAFLLERNALLKNKRD